MTTPTERINRNLIAHLVKNHRAIVARTHRHGQRNRKELRDELAATHWRYRRALAAVSNQLKLVTASRDQLHDHLEGTIEAHSADIRRYNEMAAQLAAVTAERDAAAKLVKAGTELHVALQAKLRKAEAERDALRRDYTDLLAERDALQFAAMQAGRERDALKQQLQNMEGEL